MTTLLTISRSLNCPGWHTDPHSRVNIVAEVSNVTSYVDVVCSMDSAWSLVSYHEARKNLCITLTADINHHSIKDGNEIMARS